MSLITYYSEKLKRKVTIPDNDDHTGEILEERYSESLQAAIAKIDILLKEIPNIGKGKITWLLEVSYLCIRMSLLKLQNKYWHNSCSFRQSSA